MLVIIIGPAQTKVCSGAGAAARWEETFVFNILDEHKTIQLTVMDKDTFSADDLLGSVQGFGFRVSVLSFRAVSVSPAACVRAVPV